MSQLALVTLLLAHMMDSGGVVTQSRRADGGAGLAFATTVMRTGQRNHHLQPQRMQQLGHL
jgi:hypothetical protein